MSAKSTNKNKSSLNVIPSAGYVLIEPYEAESKTSGGIYLPENATNDKPLRGRVLAVGDVEVGENGFERKSPVSVGDIVIYKKWGGNEAKIEGKEYLFAKFEDILAKVLK